MMKAVTKQVLSDYQKYFSQLRLKVDLFQQQHLNAIEKLEKAGKTAQAKDYMPVLQSLRAEIDNSNLFALVGKNGQGSLKHITGDFLPDCKTEIASVVKAGMQKQLFLHREGKKVHFDLLQPLAVSDEKGQYFFVSFKPKVFTEILKKYQLPHQQLFLMRSDHVGRIELSTENNNTQFAAMKMSRHQIKQFNFIENIPNTRWQLAIRLDPQYSSQLYWQGLINALLIWLILTLLIYAFYRQQKAKAKKHLLVKQALIFNENHDQLTGLANRNNFDVQLNQFIAEKHQDDAKTIGVAFHLDIDKFQFINNSFGYVIGDKFLHKMSIALLGFLPEDAVVSRLGSDEFALLLPQLAHQQAKDYAHQLRLLVQNINLPELDKNITVTVSIGVVMLDNSIFDGKQAFSALGQAVRFAKNKGRNRVQIYQSDDKQLQQHAIEMEALHEVQEAIKDNRVVLYRQQIKPLQQQLTPHFEILVRIKSVSGKLIPPQTFIPAAEKHGMIRQLDHWIIEHTFKMIASQGDDVDTKYSINLSGASIADRDIYDIVVALFKQYHVDPKRICFEVTETSAITHLKSALHFINSMIAFGCCFSLDDFGSGLSSFSYLQTLPVKTIKIDGIFVRDIDTNEVNRIFVENIQRTAVAMGKKTVAEFVENAEIENILTAIGIDYGQGFHIHKPELWYEFTDKTNI